MKATGTKSTANPALSLPLAAVAGMLLVAGGIGMARWLAPPVAREIGAEAGRGFMEGVTQAQNAIATMRDLASLVSGERPRGVYR